MKALPLVRERVKLNLFFFGTNIFNHPNPANPVTDISTPTTVGRILGIQTDGNASGIGMRQVTLGARLEF